MKHPSNSAWSDCSRQGVHAEELDNGTALRVEVRLTKVGSTQMQITIRYGDNTPLEEYYIDMPGSSPIEALNLGVDRARALATGVGLAGQHTLQGMQTASRRL